MDDILQRITAQYPALGGHPYSFIDSRNKGVQGGRKLEFYPPDERDNPQPGKATVELFDPAMQGEHADRAVFGDMLHYLPKVDQRFAGMRDQYKGLLTDPQRAVDMSAYRRDQQDHNETRPYDQWMDQSRLDAHIRGFLAPDAQDNWKGSYTPEQENLLKSMQEYLRTPKGLGAE